MKCIRRVFAALVCTCSMSAVHAGIPVIDGAAIAKLALQYKQLQDQYTTQNNTLSAMTGSRGMGSLLTNPAVQSSLPPEWSKVLSSIKSSPTYTAERAKLPTTANPKTNAIYDSVAASKATMTDYFTKANARIAQVMQLQASIDSASDPAAKQDLQNRMVSEQNSIAATSQLLAILKQKQEQDQLEARQTAHQSFVCREFKNANCP